MTTQAWSAAWQWPRSLLKPSRILPLCALVGALGVGLVLVALSGVPVDKALAAFFDGVAGSGYALVGTVSRAAPLALVGLGFVVADRGKLTNVGAEGQICLGGLASTAACLYWGAAKLPGPLAYVFPVALAALAGGAWGALAGWLKARRGSSEVITTLLLTFIALQMVYGAVQSEALLRQPMTSSSTLPESLEIPAPTTLPLLSSGALPLHAGLLLALGCVALFGWLLRKSRVSLELYSVGENPRASLRAGLAVDRFVIGALAASGALGGLAGALMIQGDQHYLTSGFSSGYGFDGLVVGLLSRGSPFALLGFALLFGALRSGGMAMEMSAGVPSAVVVVCQGLIVVAVAAAAALERRRA